MKPYLVLTFNTGTSSDLVINVPDADALLTDSDVTEAMSDIAAANAVSGAANIAGAKAASLFTVECKKFSLA